MGSRYFITGTGTDVGKTLVSAILTEQLKADYWKPVQAGTEPTTDSEVVKNLISNTFTQIIPSTYTFSTPASPHVAAGMEGVDVDMNMFDLPVGNRPLVVEGAGGLMVPLTHDKLILDLIKRLELPVIVVSKLYLGGINHTLLTLDCLMRHGIAIKGVIYNGDGFETNIEYVKQYTKVPVLGTIPLLPKVDKHSVKELAEKRYIDV